jgi:hypothetical protein
MTKQRFMLPCALALFLILIASSLACGEEGTVGVSPGGNSLLGEEDVSLSIDLAPQGGALLLHYGSTSTAQDKITVISEGGWKLSVKDTNSASSNSDGKMRRGSLSGAWNYDTPERPLNQNFNILVQGIGGNGDLPGTIILADATDLSSPRDIVTSSAASSGVSVDLQYSQSAIEGDISGPYRISITYTLSSNP